MPKAAWEQLEQLSASGGIPWVAECRRADQLGASFPPCTVATLHSIIEALRRHLDRNPSKRASYLQLDRWLSDELKRRGRRSWRRRRTLSQLSLFAADAERGTRGSRG